MKRININLFPRSGYVFKDPTGAIIRSDRGWSDLIVRVRDYRVRNKLPIGNVDQEVHDYACQNNPAYCSEQTKFVPPPAKPITTKGRVLAWLSELRRRKTTLEYVTPEAAQSRAGVCATCQFNKGLPTGCGSCKAAVREIRQELLGDRKYDDRLLACHAMGVDLGTAVHLDAIRIEDPQLPGFCWMKREQPK